MRQVLNRRLLREERVEELMSVAAEPSLEVLLHSVQPGTDLIAKRLWQATAGSQVSDHSPDVKTREQALIFFHFAFPFCVLRPQTLPGTYRCLITICMLRTASP
jgi:hypothetical protein